MARRRVRPRKTDVELFVSYAHEDHAWLGRMQPLMEIEETHVKTRPWTDQQIQAGDRWDREIRAALDRMDVFVCLISMDFLLSRYVREVELPKAIERENAGEIEIVPILIYPNIDLTAECDALTEFRWLPEPGKCWRDFQRVDGDERDAHGLIRRGLRQAIEKVRDRRAS